MRRSRAFSSVLTVPLLLSSMLLLAPLQARSQTPDPPTHMAPPLRGPDDYQPQPLGRPAQSLRAQTAGLKAIAIVGDVEGSTSTYKNDMNGAVNALQSHGVTVTKFYYGDSSFTWNDIVAAASGAHFLLYMGHGVYWGGSCTSPTLVGGFYLGPGKYVHPDDIRNDLAGQMANDSIAILSHVCFSAGNTACDPDGQPSQNEAERRVRMYASPFVDIDVQAYYANNYFDSAASYVNQLLADPASRKNVGDIFKSVYPYSSSKFRDLTYPEPGYDLWLSGETGEWHDAFVGIPSYVFSGDSLPEMGQLPAPSAFTYNLATAQLSPATHVITPANVGSDDPLDWDVTREGTWFTIAPASGSTPDDITITPDAGVIAGLSVGHYTGAITVTVTDPPGTANGVQRVDLGLDVIVPRLGGLPGSLGFIYYYSETVSLPWTHTVTPENVGSGDTLTWELAFSSDWLTASVTGGQTLDAFGLMLDGITATEPVTWTGWVTVTVTDPVGTEDPVQVIGVTMIARPGGPSRIYLPLMTRNY